MKKPKRRVVAIDAETDPFLFGRAPKPFVWGLYDGETFQSFRDTAELARVLAENDYLAYAHNGGKFDFEFLLEFADAGQELRIINGRLAQFKIGKTVLRDSWCIYPQALATFKKDEIDYSKMELDVRERNMPEILRYLETDVRSLHRIVSDFREDYGPGLTLAGAAMKFWEGNFDDKAPRSTRAYFDNMSRYYYGGRVESFQKGVFKFPASKPLRSYDIVSAYPYAMCQPQPWGQEADGLTRWPPKADYPRCLFSIRCRSWGAFPFRTKGGLSFPHDGEVREFHVTGWEVLAALKARPDWAMELIKCYRFKQTKTFTDYVGHFFDLKKKAAPGSTERQFAKLMLNSLYGKFAACPGPRPDFEGPKKPWSPYRLERTNYQKFIMLPIGTKAPEGFKIAGRSYPWDFFARSLTEEECRYYDVAVGAGITGFERAYLYTEFVKHFGPNFWGNPNLFYCDTDNIKGTGFEIKQSKELGGWELEGEYTLAAFAGKKLYGLEDAKGKRVVRSKGVRLTFEELMKVAHGETVTYQNPAPTVNVRRGVSFVERKVRMR